MLTPALFAFLHHVAAFTVAAVLVAELALFAPNLSDREVKRLARIDLLYGIAAAVVLAVGFARVMVFEKGTGYYFANGWFLTKLALFIAVGVLSIYPTVLFIRWSQRVKRGEPPAMLPNQVRAIRICLTLELACIAGILLAAALMARGIGYFGG